MWRSNGGVFPVDPIDGDPLQRNLILGGYLFSLICLLRYFRNFVRIIYFEPIPLLLAFFAILSVIWSKYPDVAFRRSMALLLTTLFGIFIYLRFSAAELFRLINISLWIAIIGSIALVFLKPDWGTQIYFNEVVWRGGFFQKNLLGYFTALLILVNMPFVIDIRKRKLKWFLLLLLGLPVMVMVFSKSTGALVLTVISLFLLILLNLISLLRKDNFVVVLVFFILFFLIGLLFWEKLFEFFLSMVNKDVSLTGRIPLWQTVFEIGLERIFVGYGYGSFWLGWGGPESASVWQAVNWKPPNAHNGYLDVWLQLGFIGFAIFVWMIYRLLTSFSIKFISHNNFAKLMFLLTLFILMKNVFDTVVPTHNNLNWVLFVFVYYNSLALSRKLRKNLDAKD